MFHLYKVLGSSAIVLLALFIFLAFGPKKEEGRAISYSKSLALQRQILQQVTEQQLLDAESSYQTTAEQEQWLAIRALKQFKEEPVYLIKRFLSKDRVGIAYDDNTLHLLKKDMQGLEKIYQDWLSKQLKDSTDPRRKSLADSYWLSLPEEEWEDNDWGRLQAQIAYSQLCLMEQATVDLFLPPNFKALYWPFEQIVLDWEQPPTFVGKPIQGRILVGTSLQAFPAEANGEALPLQGKGYYYQQTPNTAGEKSYTVSFIQEDPFRERQQLSKTGTYQVLSQ